MKARTSGIIGPHTVFLAIRISEGSSFKAKETAAG